MFDTLPKSAQQALDWPWEKFEPYFVSLLVKPLNKDNLDGWMKHWTYLGRLVIEIYNRLYLATTLDTTDKVASERFSNFLEFTYPTFLAADQKLKEKLIASQLEPDNFQIPLRNLRTQSSIFREANLPLITKIDKLIIQHDQIIGAQTVEWEGKELTLPQLSPVLQEPDRSRREFAYRLSAERQLEDRKQLNDLWQEMLKIRIEIHQNAGFPTYTSYRWKELLRFDYTPEDCAKFREAIKEVVVPATSRRYEQRKQKLKLESLRPWDLQVDIKFRSPLHPYQKETELKSKSASVFEHVDKKIGNYFKVMETENLLDLENRKGKAPGGFCLEFPLAKCPFIFMNAVGLHEDVQTMLHEGGHAFHVFESAHLPFRQQTEVPMEFSEVASMAMELLAAPYLGKQYGGFYTPEQVARARIEHLENSLNFWPYMAVVDGFQHWVYAHPDEAIHPENCDEMWSDLWDQFMPGINYTDLDEVKKTGWQRKLHIFQVPFYYIEYGLAQLGAVQVWHNAIKDQAGAVAAYRNALSLGGTSSLPDLFHAAGVQFTFDAGTLRTAVDLMEHTIMNLEHI